MRKVPRLQRSSQNFVQASTNGESYEDWCKQVQTRKKQINVTVD
jgi:hypothetical protein